LSTSSASTAKKRRHTSSNGSLIACKSPRRRSTMRSF
jgi:hypothetical protein